jgi:hypothetical protein
VSELEVVAAINHAWGEIQGFPHGVDEIPQPDELAKLDQTCQAIITRIIAVRTEIAELAI